MEESRMTYITGPWLQTLSPPISPAQFRGGALDLVNPKPEQVGFRAGSIVLGRIPRFGGHTERGVLSVAQHQSEGAKAILRETGNRDHAAAFLIHDFHEYALGDDATPKLEALACIAIEEAGDINAAVFIRAVFREAKRRLDAAIYPAAGLPWPLPYETARAVKAMDMRMCATERNARMAPSPQPWSEIYETAEPVRGVDLSPMSASEAADIYWALCVRLLPRFHTGTAGGFREYSIR